MCKVVHGVEGFYGMRENFSHPTHTVYVSLSTEPESAMIVKKFGVIKMQVTADKTSSHSAVVRTQLVIYGGGRRETVGKDGGSEIAQACGMIFRADQIDSPAGETRTLSFAGVAPSGHRHTSAFCASSFAPTRVVRKDEVSWPVNPSGVRIVTVSKDRLCGALLRLSASAVDSFSRCFGVAKN